MIFNKAENGAEEIKGMIGWIYKSNSYANLETYLKIAKRDVIRIIGQGIYGLALAHYLSDNYEAELQEEGEDYTILDQLVYAIQLPIALIAYRRYAPGVDLHHSEQGRQITVTDQLKPAFEWMIERDNKNIMDLAHDAIEMLLEFLDLQTIPVLITPEEGEPLEAVNEIGQAWASSEAFTASKSLFISTANEFDKVYPISGSRRLYTILVPFIREVETRHIAAIILTSRYEAIIEKIRDNDLEEEDRKILELARVPIALLTMSIALKRLSMELLPDSVIQSYTSFDPKQTRTAESIDRRGLSALLERDGRRELIPLQKYIASLSETETEEEVTDTTTPFFLA